MAYLRYLFRRGRTRTRFLLATMAICITPLLIVGFVSYVISTRNAIETYKRIASSNLHMANTITNIRSRRIAMVSRKIIASDVVMKAMKDKSKMAAGSTYLDASTLHLLKLEMDSIFIDSSEPFTLYLFGNNGLKLRYGFPTCGKDNTLLHTEDSLASFTRLDWFKRTVRANGSECFFLHDVLITDRTTSSDSPYLSTTKLLKDVKTGEPCGILIINVNKRFYAEIFPPQGSRAVCYMLVDANSRKPDFVSFSGEASSALEKAVLSFFWGKHKSNSDLILTYHNDTTDWELIHATTRLDVITGNLLIPIVTLSTVLCLILVSTFLSLISARAITKPLERLRTDIEVMKPTDHATTESHLKDDMAVIGDTFREIIERNEQLNRELNRLMQLEREAEFNCLQAQINPHFLYNALASLYWLSQFGRQEDAAEMAIALSEMFKFILDKGSNEITVAQELQHIKRYIKVQNMRYANRIEVFWDIADIILDKMIPKLIIQPLVENAICHGLEPKVGVWHLHIRGFLMDGNMIFTIEDDGVGMDIEQDLQRGHGLTNVSERILLKYGSSYGCTVSSVIGKGTIVTVCVPCSDGGQASA